MQNNTADRKTEIRSLVFDMKYGVKPSDNSLYALITAGDLYSKLLKMLIQKTF